MLFCLKTNYGVQGFLFPILYSKPNKSHKIINITLWCLKSTDDEDCKAKKQCLNIDLTCRWALRMQKYQQNNLCLHRKKCMSLTISHWRVIMHLQIKESVFHRNKSLSYFSFSFTITIIVSYFYRQRWSQFHVCWITLIYGRQEFDIFVTPEFHFDPWTILVLPSFQQEVLFEGKTISRLIFVYIQWN